MKTIELNHQKVEVIFKGEPSCQADLRRKDFLNHREGKKDRVCSALGEIVKS
jgi:hypothetical protein